MLTVLFNRTDNGRRALVRYVAFIWLFYFSWALDEATRLAEAQLGGRLCDGVGCNTAHLPFFFFFPFIFSIAFWTNMISCLDLV